MPIVQGLWINEIRKAGKSLTVRRAARFTEVDLAGRGSGQNVVRRANVATLFPWVPESGQPLPLSKLIGWPDGGKGPRKGVKMGHGSKRLPFG